MPDELRLDWRELASGCGFTEGPVAHGDQLVFTSINRGRVYRVPIGGGQVVPVAETGGGPNGAAIDAQGRLWIAQNGGQVIPTRSAIASPPSIQRIDADGRVERIASDGLTAPNDCAFGPDGRLWFTDPSGSTQVEPPLPGKLWAMDVGSGHCELMLDKLAHPNGLAFSPDRESLLVGETRRQRILRLRCTPAGWREAGVFAQMPVGEPDGMAFDSKGRLWVAATGADALVVFDESGRHFATVPIGSPSFPTNVCFGGPQRRTLFVTAPKGGRVICAEVDTPGLPLI